MRFPDEQYLLSIPACKSST